MPQYFSEDRPGGSLHLGKLLGFCKYLREASYQFDSRVIGSDLMHLMDSDPGQAIALLSSTSLHVKLYALNSLIIQRTGTVDIESVIIEKINQNSNIAFRPDLLSYLGMVMAEKISKKGISTILKIVDDPLNDINLANAAYVPLILALDEDEELASISSIVSGALPGRLDLFVIQSQTGSFFGTERISVDPSVIQKARHLC